MNRRLLAVFTVGGCSATGGQSTTPTASAATSGPTVTTKAPATVAPDTAASSIAEHACLTLAHARVCTAYKINASLGALLPYYEFSHSDNAARKKKATDQLGDRYIGNAYQQIVSRTADWPSNVKVSLPSVHIDNVVVASDEKTATLTTHETWLVTASATPGGGTELFAETDAKHTVTMQFVDNILGHKWVVAEIK